MSSALPPPDWPSEILPGYGIARLPPRTWELDDLLGKLVVWEPPRPDYRYVLSADVASGIGQDRSVADVTRVGTIKDPAEQVAQFVDPHIDPSDFAYVLDAIGRFYRGADNLSALLAVEVNGLGLTTQAELQRHIGYDNLYIWEYLDAADPAKVQTTKLGWETNKRSRPIIIGFYIKRVRSVGPDGRPDYIVNSLFTVEEMRDFVVPPDKTAVWEAEASGDAHDDCIMAGAIGNYLAIKTQYEYGESIDDQRRRLQEEQNRRRMEAARTGSLRDFRNTDMTIQEIEEFEFDGDYQSDTEA